MGGFNVPEVDAFKGAGSYSKGDCVVGMHLCDAVGTFVDGLRFVGGREGVVKEDILIDDVVMSYAGVVGLKEAMVDVGLAKVVELVQVD